jgi:hypothetical protein
MRVNEWSSARTGPILLALVAGCGGGGGGGGGDTPAPAPTPTVTSMNARTAWRALGAGAATRFLSVSGVGTDSANYQLSITIEPLRTETVNGTLTQRVSYSSVLTKNTLPLSTSEFALNMVDGTGVAFAYSEPNGDCSLLSGSSEPPATTAVIGQSGTLFSGSMALNCDPRFVLGTVSGSWRISSEGVRTFFCFNMDRRLPSQRQETCIEVIDATGTLGSRALVTLTAVTASPLVLRNY